MYSSQYSRKERESSEWVITKWVSFVVVVEWTDQVCPMQDCKWSVGVVVCVGRNLEPSIVSDLSYVAKIKLRELSFSVKKDGHWSSVNFFFFLCVTLESGREEYGSAVDDFICKWKIL